MDFFTYFNQKYFVPPWPVSTIPKLVISVELSDGTTFFAESGSLFYTRSGWVEDLIGQYILVEPISTLNVVSQHLTEIGHIPASYTREHSRFMRVEKVYEVSYPLGVIGFVPSPNGFQPSPVNGGPGVVSGGPLGPCHCVLSANPCGTSLMIPVVIT